MTFEVREAADDEVQDLMSLAIERPQRFCKGLESAGATERVLGRWDTKQKTAKATHVKIENLSRLRTI